MVFMHSMMSKVSPVSTLSPTLMPIDALPDNSAFTIVLPDTEPLLGSGAGGSNYLFRTSQNITAICRHLVT